MATATRCSIVDAQLLIIKDYPAKRCLRIRNYIVACIVFIDIGWLSLIGIIGQIGGIYFIGKLCFGSSKILLDNCLSLITPIDCVKRYK